MLPVDQPTTLICRTEKAQIGRKYSVRKAGTYVQMQALTFRPMYARTGLRWESVGVHRGPHASWPRAVDLARLRRTRLGAQGHERGAQSGPLRTPTLIQSVIHGPIYVVVIKGHCFFGGDWQWDPFAKRNETVVNKLLHVKLKVSARHKKIRKHFGFRYAFSKKENTAHPVYSSVVLYAIELKNNWITKRKWFETVI